MATEYKVVTASSLEDLKKEVEEALSNGWSLQGGVSATKAPSVITPQFKQENRGPQGISVETDVVKQQVVKRTTTTFASDTVVPTEWLLVCPGSKLAPRTDRSENPKSWRE